MLGGVAILNEGDVTGAEVERLMRHEKISNTAHAPVRYFPLRGTYKIETAGKPMYELK